MLDKGFIRELTLLATTLLLLTAKPSVSDSVNRGMGTAKGTRKPIRLDCL